MFGCINQRDGVTSIILTIKTNLSTFAIRSQQCCRHKSAQIDRKRLKICHTQMCSPSAPSELWSCASNYHKCFRTTLAEDVCPTAIGLLSICNFQTIYQTRQKGNANSWERNRESKWRRKCDAKAKSISFDMKRHN